MQRQIDLRKRARGEPQKQLPRERAPPRILLLENVLSHAHGDPARGVIELRDLSG
jgi:hypothetical protein